MTQHPKKTTTQAVYTALKETEQRATDVLPYWKVPLVEYVVPRQRKVGLNSRSKHRKAGSLRDVPAVHALV